MKLNEQVTDLQAVIVPALINSVKRYVALWPGTHITTQDEAV